LGIEERSIVHRGLGEASVGLEPNDVRELQELGLHLAKARAKRGLSQVELAERCALAQTQISYFEAGRRRPTLDQLFRIARALGVSVQRLISGSDRPGTALRDIAIELRDLGIVDLWIKGATVPGAFRRPEELIPLVVASEEPDPRILEAIPAVLLWNKINPTLLQAYALMWGPQTARRLAWLADIALSIRRKGGFPSKHRQDPLVRFVESIPLPNSRQDTWDGLGRPMAKPPTSPIWVRWKISYDATPAEFEKRAQSLAKLRKQLADGTTRAKVVRLRDRPKLHRKPEAGRDAE
jgi:transcriptional regulator with XRE-family HTH domain